MESVQTQMKNEITDGRLFPALVRFAVPLMLAILVQALYGAVDLIIVGQYGTPASVSAVAMGGQIMHAVVCVVAGLTMGGTVLIGKYYGAKDYRSTAKSIGNLITLSAILTLVLTAVVVACGIPVTSAMNVPKEAFAQCAEYIMICGGGIVFIVGYNAISAIFRGLGNSKLPFLFVLIASVVNVLLDLLFVGVLKLDSMGAAVATVIAQGVSVVFSAVFIKKRGFEFKFDKSCFRLERSVCKDLLKLGVPIATTDGLTSISFLIISAFINTLGLVASASVGIAERMFLFLIIVPMTFMSAISTFVAQNTGAGNERRALQSLGAGLCVSIVFGLCIFFFTHFGGEIIARMFTPDKEVIAATADYLKGCSYEYLVTCITYCLIGYFNGMGKTFFVMLQGLVVAFGARVPLSYAFTQIAGVSLYKIGTAVPLSAIVTLVGSLAFFGYLLAKYLRTSKREKHILCEDNIV